MSDRRRAGVATLLAVFALVSLPDAASKNFAPDVVFKGSTLTGWKPVGGG